jgi:acetyl-CoA carboxylase biotin carboxyl carrier protein
MNGTKKKAGKAKTTLASVGPASTAKAKSPKADAPKVALSAADLKMLETVRELARIIGEFGLSEVEADPSGRVRVRRVLGGAVASAPAAGLPAPAPIGLAPSPSAESAPEVGTFITSPFVGTFYRAPSPEASSFVDVGSPVRKGQVVCIVEAMKLMNEIESESDGKVAEILVKNGEHVEYGQKLIRIA